MKPLARALLLALLLALAPAAAHAQPKPLVVASGEVRAGDLATVDQPILITGVVEGDVTSWSGTITVAGEVRGDVVSYVGAITLGPTAKVGGSVMAMSGGLHSAGAAVAGQLLGDQPVAGGTLVAGVARIFGAPAATGAGELPRPVVSGALALAALLLCVALTAGWPLRTSGAIGALWRAPGRALALGLLSTLLAALLLPLLAGILALSLVGLPLLVPLLLAMQLPYLFGIAVMGRALAERLGGQRLQPAIAAASGAAALLLPLAFVGVQAPLASVALFYLIAGPGLGAAILSRGGAYAI